MRWVLVKEPSILYILLFITKSMGDYLKLPYILESHKNPKLHCNHFYAFLSMISQGTIHIENIIKKIASNVLVIITNVSTHIENP